jgi:hypothetical protein
MDFSIGCGSSLLPARARKLCRWERPFSGTSLTSFPRWFFVGIPPGFARARRSRSRRASLTVDQKAQLLYEFIGVLEGEQGRQCHKKAAAFAGAVHGGEGGRGHKKTPALNSTQGFSRSPETTKIVAAKAGVIARFFPYVLLCSGRLVSPFRAVRRADCRRGSGALGARRGSSARRGEGLEQARAQPHHVPGPPPQAFAGGWCEPNSPRPRRVISECWSRFGFHKTRSIGLGPSHGDGYISGGGR